MVYPVNRQNTVRKKQNTFQNDAYQSLEPRRLLAADMAVETGHGLESNPQLVYRLSETVPVQERFDLLADHLQMEGNEKFRLVGIQRDHLGFAHMKYQQFHNRVEVEGGTYTVHVKDREIVSVSGEYTRVGEQAISKANISEQTAFEFALADINATEYAWSNPDADHGHLHDSGDSVHHVHETDAQESFEKPTGKLVYIGQDDGEPVLAYKFDIYAIEPLSRDYVFVDANSGQVVEKYNRIHEVDAAASGTSLYNGTVNFVADDTGGNFRLRQQVNGVETYDLNNNTSYNTAVDITSTTNSFTATDVQTGVQAHFGAEKTLDYFFTNHGRDSYDDLGTTLYSYVSYGVNYVNAFWNGSAMTYGDGNGTSYGPLVSIDIVGHEISHGVTEYSAGLIYQNESGALNESFSDIFGEAIENYAIGTNDWLMGDDIGIGGSGAFRNMANPNSKGDPDTYLGDFWYTGTGDSGGVHTNSGVQNKWFYVLTEGEAGTNDDGFAYSVTGIGIDEAAEIAYRNLSVYLTSNSQYADARVGAVQSAIDLFGYGSQQHLSTADAWDAVGVYEPIIELDFKSIAPDGSMIYRDTNTGTIAGPGDIESISLFVDPGQTVSVVVQGSGDLLPTIEVLAPGNAPVGSSTGVSSTTILDSAPISTGGEYTVIVSGEADTAGDFEIDIYLNAGIEFEQYDVSNNDSLANAQDINGTSVALGNSGADRLAVLGGVVSSNMPIDSEDFESGSLSSQWTTTSSSTNGRNEVSNLFGSGGGVYALIMDTLVNGSYNLNEAIWTVDLTDVTEASLNFNHAEWADETHPLPTSFTGSNNGDGVAISEDGTTWHTVFTNTSTAAGIFEYEEIDLGAAATAAGISLGPDFQIKFQQYDNFAISDDGRAYDEINISVPSSVEDWYSFDLLADQSTTISLEKYQGSTGLLVELYDETETLLLTGISGDNAESFISEFTNTTGVDATFYVRVSGSTASYSLLATRDAKFDNEPNDLLNPIDLTGSKGALGHVATNPLVHLEPDDFAPQAVLDVAFPGVTLSDEVTGGSIYAAVANYTPPTGTQAFGPGPTSANGFRFGDNEFRADFATPKSFVSIDVGSDDSSDVGAFRAYDSLDNLLLEVTSSALSSGESETLSITRTEGDIAYVIAAGTGTDITPMDNLIYQSDIVDQDFYTIDVATPTRIDLEAFLPGLGPYQFENGLDQSGGSEFRIELTDPNGTVVATDANSISYGSSLLGTYEVRVFANSNAGEYYLQNSLTQYYPGGIDFGPDGSPTVSGFIQVSDPAYSPELGYGWTQSTFLTTLTGNVGNNLAKDKVSMKDGTFVVDIENGSYDVQIYYGVVRRSTPGDITIEGVTNRYRPPYGTNTSVIFQTVVTDGQLTLDFDGVPALDNRIRIAGIRLTETQPAKSAGVDPGGKPSLENSWKVRNINSTILPTDGLDTKSDLYSATLAESNLVLQGNHKFELPEPTKFDSLFESFEEDKDDFFENLSDEIGILV